MDKGEEVVVTLVVSGSNGTEVFELVEETFDEVAEATKKWPLAVWFWNLLASFYDCHAVAGGWPAVAQIEVEPAVDFAANVQAVFGKVV